MAIGENENLYIYDKSKLEKKFEEMNTLISMASSMQESIIKKKKEVRNLILTMGVIIYLSIMTLILLKFFSNITLSNDRFNYLILVTFVFWTILSIFSYSRIRDIYQELRIERYAMKELMEVIFNLRKTFSRYTNIDLVELTILDLKLKRLRFY